MSNADEALGVLDALDSGVAVVDELGRIAVWNDWLASASGIDAGAAVGRRFAELFPQARLTRLEQAIDDGLTLGASSLLTHSLHPNILPLRTRAGRGLIHDLAVRPVGAKPYRRCVVQVADVTVAAEREKVLRARQNARYAAVVDNAPDAILTLDAQGLIQMANRAAPEEFGFDSPKDLIGLPAAQLFVDQDLWASSWQAARSGEVQPPREIIARRRDGALTYLELSASQWQSDGRTFVSVILRDVNERHAARAALLRLNETLEDRVARALAERKVLADIVENTDALIQVLDRDLNLLAINRPSADAFERAFGRRPKVGDNLEAYLAERPNEAEAAKSRWTRALAGEAFTVEQAFPTPLGVRHFELKFNALRDAGGRPFAAFQFIYDVTDRVEQQEQLAATEEALRQSQKMEAIGQLTGGIAHDFNNLLTGIIGAMDILKRRLAAGRYEDTQRFMDAATTSASRAAALTHRLLAFARRQPLDPKATDANQLIRGIEDLLRRTLSERIKLVTDLEDDIWPALTDPNQLENALLNLAINGRDAMPDGGTLTLTTRRVEVEQTRRFGQDELPPGDYIQVRVSDTGGGIAPEALGKVFEPFFTTKPIGKGTGLGLSMIYGFAKQSRGAVEIESAVGEGTQVSLFLPRYRGALNIEGGVRERAAPEGAGETVLLVEDDSSVRLLIGEVLRDLGYSCIEASDGQTALPVLTSNTRLDLMITDVGLPGMNGRQLADFARQHRPDLRILFVTGYAEQVSDGDDFLEPGMFLVTKPFNLDALAFKIREILSSAR
ncbi:MAG: PAS domain S-box protein [Caulobacteraceae bacterium]|nr:MAG: PAS domain S-box protein [Caulobacteraceae bacterium]